MTVGEIAEVFVATKRRTIKDSAKTGTLSRGKARSAVREVSSGRWARKAPKKR